MCSSCSSATGSGCAPATTTRRRLPSRLPGSGRRSPPRAGRRVRLPCASTLVTRLDAQHGTGLHYRRLPDAAGGADADPSSAFPAGHACLLALEELEEGAGREEGASGRRVHRPPPRADGADCRTASDRARGRRLFFTADYNISNQLPTNTESAKGFTALNNRSRRAL